MQSQRASTLCDGGHKVCYGRREELPCVYSDILEALGTGMKKCFRRGSRSHESYRQWEIYRETTCEYLSSVSPIWSYFLRPQIL